MQTQPRFLLARWFFNAAYWASAMSFGAIAVRVKSLSGRSSRSAPSTSEVLTPQQCIPVPGGDRLGQNQGCTYDTVGSWKSDVLYETETVKLYWVTLKGNTSSQYIYKRLLGSSRSTSTLENLQRVLTWQCVKDGSPLFLPLDLHPTVHVSSSWKGKKYNVGHIMQAMGGDMEKFAQKYDISVRAREFENIADVLISAAKCMHGNGYTHMDIKPPNVFYHGDGKSAKMRWVLADFDDMVAEGAEVEILGHYVEPTAMRMHKNATLAGRPVGSRFSDMYQIGNSLAHLLRGQTAFVLSPPLPEPGIAYPGLEKEGFRDSDTYVGKKWKEDLVKGLTRCSEFPQCSERDERSRQIVADFFVNQKTRSTFKENGLESFELVKKLESMTID